MLPSKKVNFEPWVLLTFFPCSSKRFNGSKAGVPYLSVTSSYVDDDIRGYSGAPITSDFFFYLIFYQQFFIYFLHTTSQTQHPLKQTKQNNRHILNISKVQSKGIERGREKEKPFQKRWRNPIPHIKYVSCIRAQEIDPRCKHSNTRARSTAESKPFTFSYKISRVCNEYPQTQNCIQ